MRQEFQTVRFWLVTMSMHTEKASLQDQELNDTGTVPCGHQHPFTETEGKNRGIHMRICKLVIEALFTGY